MNKILLFTTVLAGASLFANAEQNTPVHKWSKFLTGIPGHDQSSSVVTDGAGQTYWLATCGSKTSDKDVKFGDEFLFDGADYDGTSTNKNFTLLKTNGNGDKLWVLHSNWGDFDASANKAAVAPNGDIVFCGVVRHTEGYLDRSISFTDAFDNVKTLDWSVDKRYFRMYVGRCTSDGELLWVNSYEQETAPHNSNYQFASDAITPKSLAIDADGDIYICGQIRSAMTVPAADGSDVVIPAKNLADFVGNSQATCGSMFLIKLDENGKYLADLRETGDEIKASNLFNIEIINGKIYLDGFMASTGTGKKVSFAGSELTPNAYYSPVLASINSDLTANWVKLLPGDAVNATSVIQNTGITVNNGNLWYSGMFNGKICNPDNADVCVASVLKNPREGFLIKLKESDGSWLKGTTSRTDYSQSVATGYFKPVCAPRDNDHVYVYGYSMVATIGSFLRCYEVETLAPTADLTWNLVTGGGVPTACALTIEPENGHVFMVSRGNNSFTPMGGEATENPGGFTLLLSNFDMGNNFITSGVNSIETEAVAENGTVRYYTIDGMEVANPTKGLYIKVSGNKAEKVLF